MPTLSGARPARPLRGRPRSPPRSSRVGREAALVADRGGEVALVEQGLQRVEDLDADLKSLGERLRPRRNHHELPGDPASSAGAAVHHIYHGHRQQRSPVAAEPAEERDAGVVRGGPSRGQRAPENVRAEAPSFSVPSVSTRSVSSAAAPPIASRERPGQARRSRARPPGRPPLPVDVLVPVSKLDGLEAARRRARRDRGPAQGARLEPHLDLDRRIAAGVENLESTHRADRRAHARSGP